MDRYDGIKFETHFKEMAEEMNYIDIMRSGLIVRVRLSDFASFWCKISHMPMMMFIEKKVVESMPLASLQPLLVKVPTHPHFPFISHQKTRQIYLFPTRLYLSKFSHKNTQQLS